MNFRIDNEEYLQSQVAEYLRLKYPDLLFRSDLGGIRLTPGLRARAARIQSGRAWPDLFIATAIGGYHGLFIELKKEGVRVYLKNGQLSADPHIREQAECLSLLRQEGYRAEFAAGIDAAILLIDQYLADKLNKEGSDADRPH